MTEPYRENLRDRTILVTGGAGAIGSNLVSAIASAGARCVLVLDDLSASARWNVPALENVLFIEGSVVDERTLKRVFAERPTLVFHLAAFFANQNSIDYPETDLEVNGLGTLRMLEYCRLTGVERFVYASSGCSIYGSEAELPLREEAFSMHLSTPYQITKMLGELYSNFFADQYDMEIVKTRLFNSYGPGEVPGQYRNVIPNFIYRALRGEPLPFTGHDEASRDFTWVDDIVDALLRSAYFPAAVGREINIASGRETRILDLARSINDLTANAAGIRRSPGRRWDTKVRLLARIDRARDLLGYEPTISIDEGLRKTIAWFRRHWTKIERAADFPPGMSSAQRGTPGDRLD